MGDGTKIDPVFLALQRFNRRQYDECIALCSELLANNPYDQVCVCGAWPPGAPPGPCPKVGPSGASCGRPPTTARSSGPLVAWCGWHSSWAF